MTSTPPPRSMRARTPPTPRHGPMGDDYEPYSPRRSTRSTLTSNPYSSFNSDRSLDHKKERSKERTPARHRGGITTPPPTTARKRARFAENVGQLSSPPSSPIGRNSQCKTPQRRNGTRTGRALASQDSFGQGPLSDSDNGLPSKSSSFLSAASLDPSSALLTPSKTPTRRTPVNMSSKRSFNIFVQPDSPNDVMPPSRRIKRSLDFAESELGHITGVSRSEHSIQVYTDSKDRVPELDTSDDNPFVVTNAATPLGPTRVSKARKSSRTRKSEAEKIAEARMQAAVEEGEGIIYVRRGKKIFRPFAGTRTARARSPGFEKGPSLEYNDKIVPRSLWTAPGDHAISRQRTHVNASVEQPRTEPPQMSSFHDANNADEEAETDIEMPDATTAPANGKYDRLTTPPNVFGANGNSENDTSCDSDSSAGDAASPTPATVSRIAERRETRLGSEVKGPSFVRRSGRVRAAPCVDPLINS